MWVSLISRFICLIWLTSKWFSHWWWQLNGWAKLYMPKMKSVVRLFNLWKCLEMCCSTYENVILVSLVSLMPKQSYAKNEMCCPTYEHFCIRFTILSLTMTFAQSKLNKGYVKTKMSCSTSVNYYISFMILLLKMTVNAWSKFCENWNVLFDHWKLLYQSHDFAYMSKIHD